MLLCIMLYYIDMPHLSIELFLERCGIDTTVELIQKVASDSDNWKTIAKRVMSEVDNYIPLYIYVYV